MVKRLNMILACVIMLSLAFLFMPAHAQPGNMVTQRGEEGMEGFAPEGDGPPQQGQGMGVFGSRGNAPQGNGPRGNRLQGGGGQQCQGGRGSRLNREKVFGKIIQELGLTSEQQKLIKEQQTASKSSMRDAAHLLSIKKMELKYELEKEDTDKEKIDGLVSEIKSLLGKQFELRVETTLAMKEIFTAEQYEKFKRLTRQVPGRGQRRSGMGMGSRGGNRGGNQRGKSNH